MPKGRQHRPQNHPESFPVSTMVSSEKPELKADFSTQCVIVGAGPAGGALASFLASHGESRNQKMNELS